jgi:hypothetical protein
VAAKRVPPLGAGRGSGGKRISAYYDVVKVYSINGKLRFKLLRRCSPTVKLSRSWKR